MGEGRSIFKKLTGKPTGKRLQEEVCKWEDSKLEQISNKQMSI